MNQPGLVMILVRPQSVWTAEKAHASWLQYSVYLANELDWVAYVLIDLGTDHQVKRNITEGQPKRIPLKPVQLVRRLRDQRPVQIHAHDSSPLQTNVVCCDTDAASQIQATRYSQGVRLGVL